MKNFKDLFGLITFLDLYPLWAKVAIVLSVIIVISILIFTPRKKGTINIHFSNKAPFVDRSLSRIDQGNRRWNAFFYRVHLISTYEDTTVRIRQMKLTNFEELKGQQFVPWKNTEDLILEWDKSKPIDIPPGGDVFAYFARIFPPDLQQIKDVNLTGSNEIPQLRFTVRPGGWPMKMISKIPQGTHRFKLTVYFENASPVEAHFELSCPPEQGRNSVESMVNEVKIKLL